MFRCVYLKFAMLLDLQSGVAHDCLISISKLADSGNTLAAFIEDDLSDGRAASRQHFLEGAF